MAAEQLAVMAEGGVLAPDVNMLTAGRLYAIEHYPRIIHLLQEVCGQGLVMRFSRPTSITRRSARTWNGCSPAITSRPGRRTT